MQKTTPYISRYKEKNTKENNLNKHGRTIKTELTKPSRKKDGYYSESLQTNPFKIFGEKIHKRRSEAKEDQTEKAEQAIKDLIKTDWGGSNKEQGKASELFKALAFNDSDVANKFMKKINDYTSSLKDKF